MYTVVAKKVHVRYLISWWVSCFIFAIALTELHLLRQFLAHTYLNKFPIIHVFHILYIIIDGEPAYVLKVQRDSAPRTHTAIVLFCRDQTSIQAPNLWLPNIPDDYRISERVYLYSVRDVDELRRHLNDGWSSIQQTVMIDQWQFWLRTKVRTVTDSRNIWLYILLMYCVVDPYIFTLYMFHLNVQDDNDDV